MELIKNLQKQAQTKSKCVKKAGIFKGTENFEELMELLQSELGVEFCLKYNFPTLEVFQEFNKVYNLTDYGIYVDSGKIQLHNKAFILAVGDTHLIINYDTENKENKVVLMHDAIVEIANKYDSNEVMVLGAELVEN